MRTSRRRYLYTYDVSDDKRRNQVFKTLRDYGNHAQYSVFFCELTSIEGLELNAQLRSHIHEREDQVLILDLGHAENPLDAGLDCLGRAYVPESRVVVV